MASRDAVATRILLGSPHQENEPLGSVYPGSDNKRLARTCDVIRCRRSSRRRTRPQPCHSCIAACSYPVEQEPFRLIWRNRFSLVLDSATEHIFPVYVASRDARIALLTNFWSFFGLVSPYFSNVRVVEFKHRIAIVRFPSPHRNFPPFADPGSST